MPLTFFIAQLFGFLFVVTSISMAFQRERILEVINGFFSDKALLFFVGTINLASGLLIVLSHNIWTGGSLSLAVTLLGWLLALRGIAFLCVPSYSLERLYNSINLRRHYYTYTAFVLIIGLYFIFAGFGWLA